MVFDRKDVLEQKIKKVLEEIGLIKKIGYKVCMCLHSVSYSWDIFQNLFRWPDGPVHNGVHPVVVEFKDKKDRNEVYYTCKEGLKKTAWVITEDSRYREIILNFTSNYYDSMTIVL